eukprot:4734064-Prorocentrum_lima.AAC.1
MKRSVDRRWAPGEGAEWELLRLADNYTAAYHITRLLANGLFPPSSDCDERHARTALLTCTMCGASP